MAPVLRSMTKAALMLPTTPPTAASTNTSPNLFSHLPAELRSVVYSYLNFPIAGHIWIDCPGHPTCTRASHMVLPADPLRPVTAHAHKGVFEVRLKFKKLRITHYWTNRRSLVAILFHGNGKTLIWNLLSKNLLAINKEIRAELMDLVFRTNQIEFGRVPVNIPRFFHWEDRCFGLLASTFTHMTSITVQSQPEVLERHVWIPPVWDDSEFIHYLITHATSLRSLAYGVTWLANASVQALVRLIKLAQAITTTAKKLETLRFIWDDTYWVANKNTVGREFELRLDKGNWNMCVLDILQLSHAVRRTNRKPNLSFISDRWARITTW